MRLYFCIFFSLSWFYAFTQYSVDSLDRAWKTKVKGKLSVAKLGTTSNGLAVFYYKTSNQVFSIEERVQYKSGRNLDSSRSFQVNFLCDTLNRVFIHKSIVGERKGYLVLYLNKGRIVAEKVVGDVLVPDLSWIESYTKELFTKAESILNSKQ